MWSNHRGWLRLVCGRSIRGASLTTSGALIGPETRNRPLHIASSRLHSDAMDNPISTKAAILQALLVEPSYGKDLIERIKKQTKGAVEVGLGSIYPAIRSLEGEKLIVKNSTEGRASIYRLTAGGKKAAERDKKTVAVLFGLSAPA